MSARARTQERESINNRLHKFDVFLVDFLSGKLCEKSIEEVNIC